MNDELILSNLVLVQHVARQIYKRTPRSVDMDELIAAGNLGLVDAAAKFKPARHLQFRTYATFRVRGAILDSLRALDWGSRELRVKSRAVARAQQLAAQRLGREPEADDVAVELRTSVGDYQRLLGELNGLNLGSIDELRPVDVPTGAVDPCTAAIQEQSTTRLIEAIQTLSEIQQIVVHMYYYEEFSMREVGDLLGMVESRVSQIHSKALTNLQSLLDAGSAVLLAQLREYMK